MSSLRIPDMFEMEPMDDLFRDFMRPMRWGVTPAAPRIKVDVSEQDGSYLVKADIPGVRKEDIDVRIEGNQVALSAEIKHEKESKDAHSLRCERYHGFMNRTFSLGADIDQSKAKAKYEDGVLELELPKKASTESHKLAIA